MPRDRVRGVSLEVIPVRPAPVDTRRRSALAALPFVVLGACAALLPHPAHAQDPILWSMNSNALQNRTIYGYASYGAAASAGLSFIQGNCLISESRSGYSASWHIAGAGEGLFCPDFTVRAYCVNFGQPDPATGSCPTYGNRPSLFKDCGAADGEAEDSGPCKLVGHPIYPATGNKHLREVDYQGAGLMPLRFARYYNTAAALAGRLGRQWQHEYERSVSFEDVSGNAAFAFRHTGTVLFFRREGTAWIAASDVNAALERLTDAQGNPTGWRLRTASDDIETYDSAGRLLQIANRAGVTTTLTYDAAGGLIRVTDPAGRALTFQYDARGRLAGMADPGGGQYTFAYVGVDLLGSVTYPDGRIRSYLYQDPSPNLDFALTGVIDENGGAYATYTYLDTTGSYWTLRALTSELAGGVDRVSIQYGSTGVEGQPLTVTDALGKVRTIVYDVTLDVGRPSRYEEPCPGCPSPTRSQTMTYDGQGNLASRTDWNGTLTTYQYDLARNLETSRTEASGTPEARTITTEWHPAFRLPTRITEPKRETTMSYDTAKGTLLTRSVRDTTTNATRTWTYTYDANGQVLTVDGPRTDVSDVTAYSYHPNDDLDPGKRGNLATITNALGQVTQITAYNAHGQPTEIRDPNGRVTTIAYDARQRLTARNVGGETTSYTYDAVGQLTRVTLPDGSFLNYTYDAAHRLTAIADSLGNRIAYTLDLAGNRSREEVFDPANALAQTRSRVYSNLSRLSQELGAQNQTTSYAYDNQGNLTAITDPLNRVTANAYDALHRLKQMTDPASGVTRYGYDGIDQLTSVTDPRNNATTYTVDGLGNLTAQLSPDTGSTTNTQDAAGNVTSSTDAKGQTTTSTYDALNRLTRVVYTQATGSQLRQIDYAYDQGSFGIGRLTAITETSAAGNLLQTIAYGYDQRGRVISEARTIGGVLATTGYAYDAAGRMTGMTYPSGRAVSYQFDALGRVNRIETSGGGTSQVVLQDVAYQPFGPVKGFTFGNLQAYARTFDLDGRIASHSLANQTKALTFDPAGRISRIEQQGAPTNFADYGYDALDRLASTILPASTVSYSYDAVGNRLSKSTGAGTDTYAISPTSNRLASISGATVKTYAHDPNGSITGDGTNAFVYDPRGRLVSSSSAIGATTYQMNALGQRVRKTSSLGDVLFHYDTQGRLIAEATPAGAPIREYLWLGDQPVAVAAYSGGGSCPAAPTIDTSNTFAAFANLERLEVRSGRLGAADWEWGLGTNTQQAGQFATANLNWVNGKVYDFTLSYAGTGAATMTVRDGGTVLFTQTWATGMDAGNALKLYVKSNAGIGAGNKITLTVSSIDGQAVAETLATAGDGNFSEASRVYAGTTMQDGFTVEGTVKMDFTGSYPPQGSRLNMTITAGNVTCAGGGGSPTATLYYVHADHLNTPRAVTNQAQQVVWRWENSEPFGNSPPEENPSGIGSFEFNLRFPGQYFDKETGLAYNYFRDYDPQTGRYVQSDPIGLAGGINPYLYVDATPLLAADPLGLAPLPPRAGGQFLPHRECNRAERDQCAQHCRDQGREVERCYVRRSMQIIGATGEGKKRYGVKEELICSCKCGEKEPGRLRSFLDWLLQPTPKPFPDPFDDRSRDRQGPWSPPGVPGFGPMPIPVP